MDKASVIHERPVVQFTERPEASEETLRRFADSDACESSLTPRQSNIAKVRKKKKAKRVKTQKVNEGQEGKGAGGMGMSLWFFLVRSQDVQRLSRLRFWVYMQPGLNL